MIVIQAKPKEDPSRIKEVVHQGREVTLAALRFSFPEERSQEEELLERIQHALEQNPTIDLLVTPEYCLHYSHGRENKESEDEHEPVMEKEIQVGKVDKYSSLASISVSLKDSGDKGRFSVREPFEFRQEKDGTYSMQAGDPKLIQTVKEIQNLAASHKTNILLGTVCEKRTINEYDLYQNTLLVINHEGEIVKLRRKINETDVPTLSNEEQLALKHRFNGTSPSFVDPNPAYQAYIQAETETRQSLSPVTLQTRTGDSMSILPVICAERSGMRELLAKEWGQKIDIVSIAIDEGDDRINTMQHLSTTHAYTKEYKWFKYHFGFDLLANKNNPNGVFVVADAAGAAAGVFSVNQDQQKQKDSFVDSNVVVSLRHNLW